MKIFCCWFFWTFSYCGKQNMVITRSTLEKLGNFQDLSQEQSYDRGETNSCRSSHILIPKLVLLASVGEQTSFVLQWSILNNEYLTLFPISCITLIKCTCFNANVKCLYPWEWSSLFVLSWKLTYSAFSGQTFFFDHVKWRNLSINKLYAISNSGNHCT